MQAMNFYTTNSWTGSNYDGNLSTKEIAAKVRVFAKNNFPEFKFSVRSEWSMYTDSVYIELKAGPCAPFVDGSASAQRGYMSTMSSVKGWETDLTPETFAALDAVTTYAASFRYDDSDGMLDYFDTNFYLKIEISYDYQVIDPQAKKSAQKEEKAAAANVEEHITDESLDIVDYSEKAIAVFGETKAIKDQLKELGGRFNPSLNYNGGKRAGWIFSKKQAGKVEELVKGTELPTLPEVIIIPELADNAPVSDIETTAKEMREAAMVFLSVADELNEQVSAYIDGSHNKDDISAYHAVKEAEAEFLRLYNGYYDENIKTALNYELAESVI